MISLIDGSSNLIRFDFDSFVTEESKLRAGFRSADGLFVEVEYKPNLNPRFLAGDVDLDKFVITLFSSPYLNAESNVFAIYETSLKSEKIGWALPINYIDSSQSDELSQSSNVDLYRMAAFKYLISYEGDGVHSPRILDEAIYSASDFFNEDLVALVLHKETLEKINGFSVNDYLISLFKSGYTVFSSGKIIYNENKRLSIESARQSKKLFLKKSLFDISGSIYVQSIIN